MNRHLIAIAIFLFAALIANAQETNYAKCDFVPGDEIIFEDNFEMEKLSEFPLRWDLLEGYAETAKQQGRNVIAFTDNGLGQVMPLMKEKWAWLPEVFTVEFDLYVAPITEEEETSLEMHLSIGERGDNSYYNAPSHVRIAQGAGPLYDRLTSDGKITTYAITFETGKADLKPESIIEINRVAKLMQEHPEINFEVQGHCDNTGSDNVNDPLSQKRAEAIVAALVKQGIAKERLTAVGKGSHSPIADNSTAEGRAKNRRVEFVKK